MKIVLADTSYYVALFNRRDEFHALASRLSNELTGLVLVSEFVLLELGNALFRPSVRQRFGELIEQMRADPEIIVVPSSDILFEKALTFFETRPDKEWSLIDCSSFTLMHEYGITEALTADHHFEQAGFTILLK